MLKTAGLVFGQIKGARNWILSKTTSKKGEAAHKLWPENTGEKLKEKIFPQNCRLAVHKTDDQHCTGQSRSFFIG